MSFNTTPVEEGQTVDLDGKKVQVLATCKVSNGHWFCVTHQEGFPTQLNKDSHISQKGSHVLAWVCYEHGIEAP